MSKGVCYKSLAYVVVLITVFPFLVQTIFYDMLKAWRICIQSQ